VALVGAATASLDNSSSSLLNWLYCWELAVFMSRLFEDEDVGVLVACWLVVMIVSDLARGEGGE